MAFVASRKTSADALSAEGGRVYALRRSRSSAPAQQGLLFTAYFTNEVMKLSAAVRMSETGLAQIT